MHIHPIAQRPNTATRRFVVAALLVGLGLLTHPAAATPDAPTHEQAIRRVIAALDDAWSKGLAGGIAALFTPDGDNIGSSGKLSTGPREIEQSYGKLLTGIYKGTKYKNEITRLRMIAPNVAICDSTYVISGITGPEAGGREGRITTVLTLQNGKWLISARRGAVPTPSGATTK